MNFVFAAVAALGLGASGAALARQTDIPGPAGSVAFGARVAALPNGNLAITDPQFDDNRGAVHLYAPNGQRISTLRGSAPMDRVGLNGLVVLPSGNFLVLSGAWNNGPSEFAGAVTWINGTTGLDGVLSPQNSLVGTHPFDGIGAYFVKVLKNGNYVIGSPSWDRDKAGSVLADAGAVTFGLGTAGVAGPVNETNSIVGSAAREFLSNTTELANGNFVVTAPLWDAPNLADVGAARWVDGRTGGVGELSATNSLTGARAGDNVGTGVYPLAGGGYYVGSVNFSDGAHKVGALTWCSGTAACAGPVTTGNSVVGAADGDLAEVMPLPLPNGKLLVGLPSWAGSLGAFTLLPGAPISVRLSTNGMLHGAAAGDRVGQAPKLLANGNAVVLSPDVNGKAGAVTFVNAATPPSGTVSVLNSLLGAYADDGRYMDVLPLSNGGYVVGCAYCDVAGVVDSGGVVWAGAGGVVGQIGAHNALHGATANDHVGTRLVALNNGNYVVGSPFWNNSALFAKVGAATWVNGANGRATGEADVGAVVSGANSLIGSTGSDQVGNGLVGLANGNYLVVSRYWSNAGATGAGAVTWGNGAQGRTGVVDAANSLIGASTNDDVGSGAILVLPDGNAVIGSPSWDERYPSGAVTTDGGAFTWIDGKRGISGPITVQNSVLSGGQARSYVGAELVALPGGDYLMRTTNVDYCVQGTGCVADAGAVTLAPSSHAMHGRVEARNSVLGTQPGEGSLLNYGFDVRTDQLVVGRPLGNVVSLLDRSLFQDGFE